MQIDIGVIGAMEAEIEGLVASLSNMKEETVGSVKFFLGEIYGKKIALTKCGVGKVFAAVAAEAMVVAYAPKLIVNTGVGGAIANGIKTTDVVIAQKLVQHDMDTSALGDPRGLISGIDKIFFEADARAVEIIKAAAEEKGINAKIGTIASGDRFVAKKADKDRIASEFGASACEMEGGAVAHVAFVNNTPFAVIRAISDSADGEATMDYPTFMPIAAKISQALTLALIEKY